MEAAKLLTSCRTAELLDRESPHHFRECPCGEVFDMPVEEPSKASQPDSRSKFECSAAAWGPFNEFGLVANRSQPELFAGFPHYSARAHRYRSGFVAWPFSPMRRRLIN
jgi:hypothetical protein